MDTEADHWWLEYFFCCIPLEAGAYVMAIITAAVSAIMISLTTNTLLIWAALPDYVVVWIGN